MQVSAVFIKLRRFQVNILYKFNREPYHGSFEPGPPIKNPIQVSDTIQLNSIYKRYYTKEYLVKDIWQV